MNNEQVVVGLIVASAGVVWRQRLCHIWLLERCEKPREEGRTGENGPVSGLLSCGSSLPVNFRQYFSLFGSKGTVVYNENAPFWWESVANLSIFVLLVQNTSARQMSIVPVKNHFAYSYFCQMSLALRQYYIVLFRARQLTQETQSF
jgi:hypothetical protein